MPNISARYLNLKQYANFSCLNNIAAALLAIASCFFAVNTNAKPYTPNDDDEILLRLPPQHISGFSQNSDSMLTDELAFENALQQAQNYILLARQHADPRLVGLAQATINPWINDDGENILLQLTQVQIYQYNHQFHQALQLYQRILGIQPRNPQALLNRASLYRLQGNYFESTQDCKNLIKAESFTIGYICTAITMGMNGKLDSAFRSLQQLHQQRTQLPDNIQIWLLVNLAEMAERMGDDQTAGAYYYQLLSFENIDQSIREQYAEFLLRTGNYNLLHTFFQNIPKSTGIEVRAATAFVRQQSNDLPKAIDNIKARFEREKQRGENSHLRELAYFHLLVLRDAVTALPIARENWLQQREPIDILLYYQAATAAQHDQSKKEIKLWINSTEYEDSRLQSLSSIYKGVI